MKAILDLPDELALRLERRAFETGTTSAALMTNAIESMFAATGEKRYGDIRDLAGIFAGYEAEIEDIDLVIESEFGQIEPEMWK